MKCDYIYDDCANMYDFYVIVCKLHVIEYVAYCFVHKTNSSSFQQLPHHKAERVGTDGMSRLRLMLKAKCEEKFDILTLVLLEILNVIFFGTFCFRRMLFWALPSVPKESAVKQFVTTSRTTKCASYESRYFHTNCLNFS